jgi:hypothetical protein
VEWVRHGTSNADYVRLVTNKNAEGEISDMWDVEPDVFKVTEVSK